MKVNIIEDFLVSFFKIFNASLYEYRIENKKINGNIRWNDDDQTQEFSWVVELKKPTLKMLNFLCDYLFKNKLINGDKIIISQNELLNNLIELGWDFNYAKRIVNKLLSIEITMVDEGEETDSFFVHF
ncbi:MAG: hypothetical protein BWY27_00875 [Bacteroidetes bacterium ADurb.Bin234]|nr:MAG: hypothetical protein BWY27_00875 [Bacteroidetes bacterium ADurb.Bin234]